jgi:hypothetical protein
MKVAAEPPKRVVHAMVGSRPARSEQKMLDVAVLYGRSGAPNLHKCVPAGHSLSRACLRHFCESDWIVVTEGPVPVGLAAYKRAESDVRVVYEFLVDRTLAGSDAARVTDVLVSALELVAYDDGIRCLTFLLRYGIVMRPFEGRSYTSLAIDGCTWLQKKLGWPGWCEIRSDRPN